MTALGMLLGMTLEVPAIMDGVGGAFWPGEAV